MATGSLHALAWAKQVTCGANGERITPTEKLCLLLLCDYSNPAVGGWAWPSVARLSRELMVTERQVTNLTRRLESVGLISVQRRATRTGGNRYRPLVGAVPAPAPDTPAEQVTETELAELTATEVRTALIDELLPVLLDECDTPAAAYAEALDVAETLAKDNDAVSRDLRSFLRNAVLIHAAESSHSLDPKSASRLLREAKTLGADGHRWISAALWHTASADVTGDPCSYVIATARRLKADRSQGVTA